MKFPQRYLGCSIARGMSLLELLIAMALTSLLLLGLVQVVAAAGSAARFQNNQGQLAENSRYAIELLRGTVRQAAFSPLPWDENLNRPGLTEGTADSVSRGNDRLVIRSWSDLNCFNNRNPVENTDGTPRFYIRESSFDLTGSKNLAHGCRYGPSEDDLSTQIQRQGIISGIDSFQLLFGEDADGDGDIERWVKAGQWLDRERIRAVRVGILLASEDAVTDRAVSEYAVLDARVRPRANGKLRRLIQFTAAIKGNAG
jgi:type IV pilus assembly protein PilW